MTEQEDEIRLKELLSVFGEDRQKEIIEILNRDQKRYHKEQLILSGVRLSLFNEVYDKFVECENDDEFTQYLNENTNEA
jgi:chromosome segregation and condensation protein ScpB